MLSLAVKTLRQGGHWDPDAPLESSLEINLHAPALLPEDYCGDVQERLILYKRLANCEHTDALNALQEELIDRFGLLPQVTKTLLEVHRLRIHATPLGIRKIDAHETGALIQFVTPPPFDAQAFIQLVQKQRYRLAGSDRLRLVHEAPEPQQRADIIQRFLEQLRSLPAAP